MRYFAQIQSLTVPQSLLQKARNFAKQVMPTVGTPGKGYQDTHQSDLTKIQYDHFISKVGEEAVRIVFERLGRQVKGPDYEIYAGQQKSWDYDLYIDEVGVAVKTQSTTSSKRFGLSWTFQLGPWRRDPILDRPNDWVVFVEVNDVTFHCRVFPPYQIKELEFGEPRLVRLKGLKKVVYAETLPVLR